MMASALSSFPNPQTIPLKNISTLESIGREEIQRRWNQIAGDNAK